MVKLPKERNKRLMWIVVIVAVVIVAVSLVMFALRESISVFYTPSQVLNNQVDRSDIIRVGGMVKPDSVRRKADSLKVSFIITDTASEIIVNYNGSLPDLFREGKGVIVQGRVDEKEIFTAQQVLAKHDENYMPPPLRTAADKKPVVVKDPKNLVPKAQQKDPGKAKE